MTTNYPTNLTDDQYCAIIRIIGDKRKRKNSLREVWNAIFYLLTTGCQWRMLPSDFPKWQTVYYHFARWTQDGTIEEINDILREQTRIEAGREVSPSAALIDSQSVKTTRKGGQERGFDGGKNVKGRKRHIVTDTMGLVLSAVVHTAGQHDSRAGFEVIKTLQHRFPRLTKIFADGGYRGELVDNVRAFCGWQMEITLRSDKAVGFEVLPMRWVVERSFSWFENFRRLAKDYEYNPRISESMIYLAFMAIMLHRIRNCFGIFKFLFYVALLP